jgi:hypothetical protein
MEDSGNLTIYPGDFIKVNYDVYLWTQSEDDSTVVIGEIVFPQHIAGRYMLTLTFLSA